MMPPVPLAALVAIVRAGGALARKALDETLEVSRKDDGSPVTEADRAIDTFLRRELTGLVPEAGWLSEESMDDRGRLARELVWIVDPIDGTSQLVRHIPEIAVSVALVRGGRPVAAVVLNPATGEEGAWVEGAPPRFLGLAPREAPRRLEEVEALVSRSETDDGDLIGLEGITGSQRAVGSVAYKLLRVAAGADAVTFSVRPKREWDVCAGVGLVWSAGRAYLRTDGRETTFNGPTAILPCGGVAGPLPLADALVRQLLVRRPPLGGGSTEDGAHLGATPES